MPLVISALAEPRGVTVLAQRLTRETKSRPVTCIVGERHLGLYRHVARFRETQSCSLGCICSKLIDPAEICPEWGGCLCGGSRLSEKLTRPSLPQSRHKHVPQ